VPNRHDRTPPPIARVMRPFQEFAHAESAGGVLLMLCTVVALVWANSPWSEAYFHLWETPISLRGPFFAIDESLHHLINDGLMAVFFFLVGLEIKRELLVGELSSLRQASLPIAAAVGGMLVPALFYVAFTRGTDGIGGWGIPMATDIAFALGVLSLLGSRVPIGLKVFLTALAIVDDMGAVLVIALFYNTGISWAALGGAGVVLAMLVALNLLGARRPAAYGVLGVVLWYLVLQSGVHATIAGVLLAMTIPSSCRVNPAEFLARARDLLGDFARAGEGKGSERMATRGHLDALHGLEQASEQAQAPLQRIEDSLHTPVGFVIMPLFALANAGVRLDAQALGAISGGVSLGVIAGLVLGKPLGISLFSWLAIRLGAASLPEGVGPRALLGAATLGGIGFTMSLFIAALAFGEGARLDEAKLGILLGSVVAGLAGWTILRSATRPTREGRDGVPGAVEETAPGASDLTTSGAGR
jgi:NhaA family Na+:H+ antiporter